MKLILVLTFLAICFFSTAQVTFIKTYNNANDYFNSTAKVVITNDGGYLFTSFMDECQVTKTDATGNLMWSKEFVVPGDAFIYQSIQTMNGGFAFAGVIDTAAIGHYDWNMFLMIADSLGNLLSVKEYDALSDESTLGLYQMPDSGFILVGGNIDTTCILRTDKNCDTLWTRHIPFTGQALSSRIYSDKILFSANLSSGNISLFEVDSLGSIHWSMSYTLPQAEIQDVIQTTDNGYLAVGCVVCYGPIADIIVLKTDSIGNTLWFKKFYSTKRELCFALAPATGNEVALCGFVNDTLDFGTFMIRLSPAGDTLWTKEYPLNGGGSTLLQTSDGGHIMYAGHTDIPNKFVGLIKTDVDGNITCATNPFNFTIDNLPIQDSTFMLYNTNVPMVVTSPVIVQTNLNLNSSTLCFDVGVNSTNTTTFSKLILSPNPFHTFSKLEIGIDSDNIRNCVMRIYNVMGILQREDKISNDGSYIMHRKGLSDGLYFYELRTNNYELLGTGKFIIE